jgi:hemerythrin
MALIEWSNALYSVKIDSFDNDHKKLLQYINDLHSAMLKGQGKDALSKILNDLSEYTHYHFKAEEKQMLESGYPDYEEHKRLHNELTVQLTDLMQDYKLGKREVSIETFKFLKEWLFNHIQVADKKYTPWLLKIKD